MLLNRASLPDVSKNPRRFVFRKRGKIEKIKITIVIFFIIFLSVMVLFFLSQTMILFFPAWQDLKSELTTPNYATLLHQSLPGMGQEEKKILNIKPFPNYLKLLLGSQLPNFDCSDKEMIPSSEAPSLGNESAMPQQHEVQDEVVSYLRETSPQNPKERPLLLPEKGPLVLIYHTHATESFLPESGKAYTQNPDQSVINLGCVLAEVLEEEYGIAVLHHNKVYDIPRRYAYEKAGPDIEELLKENPQIQIVLDLHRDGVARRITTASINGMDTGRLLFVLGTRHGGWHSNLRLALFLQGFLEEKYPDLFRGILKRNLIYNQHLHARSLLVEIGGHENSMEEVKRCIPYLAEAIVSIFK